MKSRSLKFSALIAAIVFSSAVSFAGTVTGTIRNGTNGKPGSGLDVILIQLQGGMQGIATVKSDAQGRFTIDNPAIGSGPMLIRVPYKGVNYHQPLTPGTATISVEIFEPTSNPSSVTVTQHDIVLQPSSGMLLLGEEFTVENDTQPPVAFFKDDGTFTFVIPKGAELQQVSAWSSAGMPVVQATMDKGKNQSAIAFAFRPGKNGVRISYQLPYSSNQAALEMISPYAAKQVLLVAPPTVQINAAGFAAGGEQEGYAIYGRDSVPPNTALQISVSGTAPTPDANAAGGAGSAGNGSAGGADNPSVNSRARDTTETVGTLPARLDSLKWILVGGFAAIFLLGILFLWKRPQPSPAFAGAPGSIAPTVSVAAVPARPSASAPASEPRIAQVDTQVRGSLDDLKEKLFRLELRHQAGTISDEDYAHQRTQFEQTLRELVRG
jgi:hypothetical protein